MTPGSMALKPLPHSHANCPQARLQLKRGWSFSSSDFKAATCTNLLTLHQHRTSQNISGEERRTQTHPVLHNSHCRQIKVQHALLLCSTSSCILGFLVKRTLRLADTWILNPAFFLTTTPHEVMQQNKLDKNRMNTKSTKLKRAVDVTLKVCVCVCVCLLGRGRCAC